MKNGVIPVPEVTPSFLRKSLISAGLTPGVLNAEKNKIKNKFNNL